MENVDLSVIPGRLGSWNWSTTDTIECRAHDQIVTPPMFRKASGFSRSASSFPLCLLYVEGYSQGTWELFDPDRGLGFHGYKV